MMSVMLIAALLFTMMPQRLVMAGEEQTNAYHEAVSACGGAADAFWAAIDAYNGVVENEIVTTKGAYDKYMEVKDGVAEGDIESLYQAALAARSNCVTSFSSLENAYTSLQTAYGNLSESEKVSDGSDYNNFVETYSNAQECMNDLREVPAPDAGSSEGESTIYVDASGNIFRDPDAPTYWKVSSETGKLVEATEADYSLWIQRAETGESVSVTMTLRNFVFTSDPGEGNEGDAIWSEVSLTLELIGTNSITAKRGNALSVNGNLTIKGSGSLELNSVSGKIIPGEGEPYTPMALLVEGSLTNESIVSCSSNNDITVSVGCGAQDLVNTGTLSVGEGQKISTMDGSCTKLVDPTQNNYQSIADYPVPTDHPYVAKAYYYTPDTFYPNDIYDYGNGNTSQWTIVGQYNADGTPKGSKIYYQYWFVDGSGGMLTEDVTNPIMYLVYEDEPETLIRDKDIVSVTDGLSHTFNADLYALWFTDGNVTVNGDVIQDLACANVGEREPDANPDGSLTYKRDTSGNRVWLTESTTESKVTVNGNVGLISLNNSYNGDVTVNGNVDLIGYYDDMASSVVTTLSPVPETFYGSKANAGSIIADGNYSGIGSAMEGYKGYCVYDTEDFYVMTERNINGETVHGTAAAIGGDSLLVDVTKSAVGNTTYPCAKKVATSRENQVKGVLTQTDSKLVVMDISLIQDNARKVEPQTTVNLSIDNLTGFTKPAVFHVKDNGEIEKLFAYDGSGVFGGTVTCETNSFSTYFIAEDQPLSSNTLGTSQTGPIGTGETQGNEASSKNSSATTTNTSLAQTAVAENTTVQSPTEPDKTQNMVSPKTSNTSTTELLCMLLFVGMTAAGGMRLRRRKRIA